MPIKAEEFSDVMDLIKTIKMDSSRSEKRRAVRIGYKGRLGLIPVSGEAPPMEAIIRNFSSTGLCVVHTHGMMTGTQFVLVLPRSKGRPVPVLCEVMHSHRVGPNLYSTGAAFKCMYEEKAHHVEKKQADVTANANANANASSIYQAIAG